MKFLVTTVDGGGNTPPVAAIVASLLRRGHHVRILAGQVVPGVPPPPQLLKRYRDLGCEVVAPEGEAWKGGAAAPPDPSKLPAEFPRVTGQALFGMLSAPWAVQTAEQISDFKPRAVLVDWCTPGAASASEASGVPYALLIHTVLSHRMLDGVPIAGGVPGDDLADQGIAYVRACEEHVLSRTNAGRARMGLPPDSDPWGWEDRAARCLVLTSPAFDFLPDPMPPNIRYTGMIAPDGSAPPWESPWTEDDERPLVLVSITTTVLAAMSTQILKAAAEALSTMPVRGLITIGEHLNPADYSLNDNLHVQSFVPHEQVLPGIAAAVTQCGHGTTMTVLRHGVPLVCTPVFGDQSDVAVRVEYRGAGVRLGGAPQTDDMEAALAKVLNDDEYRRSAQQLARSLSQEDGAEVAADEIEAAAG